MKKRIDEMTPEEHLQVFYPLTLWADPEKPGLGMTFNLMDPEDVVALVENARHHADYIQITGDRQCRTAPSQA